MATSLRRRAGLFCLAAASITFAGCAVIGVAERLEQRVRHAVQRALEQQRVRVFSLVNAFVNALSSPASSRCGAAARRPAPVCAPSSPGRRCSASCELASIALAGKLDDSTARQDASTGLRAASLLVVAGLLVCGVATVRAGAWSRLAALRATGLRRARAGRHPAPVLRRAVAWRRDLRARLHCARHRARDRPGRPARPWRDGRADRARSRARRMAAAGRGLGPRRAGGAGHRRRLRAGLPDRRLRLRRRPGRAGCP